MPKKKTLKQTLPRCRSVVVPSTQYEGWLRAHIQRQGGDPDSVPPEPFHLMRPSELMSKLGISEATFWRMVRDRKFPKPLPFDRTIMTPLSKEALLR